MSDAHPATDDRYAAFSIPSFRYYWFCRLLNNVATQIVSVAVGWFIYDLTRNPFDLGLVGILQFLPALLLVLVTGAVADRHDRRRIMFITIGLEALCVFALLGILINGVGGPLPIFVVLVVFGLARAFMGPASSSLVANIVPEDKFANAIAWNSTVQQFATIFGPVFGGLLYGISAELAFITAAIFLMTAAGLSLMITQSRQSVSGEQRSTAMMLAGFKYIWREKIVLGAISLDLFAVLLGGAVALMPVFARDILDLGPWGLGLLRSAPGIGALVVSLWLAGHPMRDNAGVIMLVSVGLFGLFTTLFGLSTIGWISIAALMGLGAADMVSVYVRQTLIQLWTPDHLRGRVSAVNQVFIGASNEVGEFRAGTMAVLIGVVPAVALGGLGAVGVAVTWAYLFPELRRVRHLQGRH